MIWCYTLTQVFYTKKNLKNLRLHQKTLCDISVQADYLHKNNILVHLNNINLIKLTTCFEFLNQNLTL